MRWLLNDRLFPPGFDRGFRLRLRGEREKQIQELLKDGDFVEVRYEQEISK